MMALLHFLVRLMVRQNHGRANQLDHVSSLSGQTGDENEDSERERITFSLLLPQAGLELQGTAETWWFDSLSLITEPLAGGVERC